jgi:hypothetical protein
MSKQTRLYIFITIGVLVLGGGYYYLNHRTIVMNSFPTNNSAQMDSVIDSQKAQYEILLRQNVMPDTCAAAKTIAMLYLQQEDETNYATWNATATSCEEAYIASQSETSM